MSITGERLKQRRKTMKLSADDIAIELGVSRSTIFRYESGQIEKVPASSLETLAEILYTTPAYLMGWTDDPEDWERTANDNGICPPNDYDGDPKDWYNMKAHAKEDHYYLDDETRQIAQEVFHNPQLRSLFHAARDISPERLKSQIDYLKFLKAQEKGDTDEGC